MRQTYQKFDVRELVSSAELCANTAFHLVYEYGRIVYVYLCIIMNHCIYFVCRHYDNTIVGCI